MLNTIALLTVLFRLLPHVPKAATWLVLFGYLPQRRPWA